MASKRNPQTSESTIKKTSEDSWFTKHISWFVPLIINVSIVSAVAVWQLYKYVEADLTVTSVEVKSDNTEGVVYTIDFVVNNSGNQSVIVIDAAPFIRHKSRNKPPLMLLNSYSPEKFQDNVIEAGKIKSFSIDAIVSKSFINVGMKEFDNQPANMPIEIGVRIYGADGVFRAASSIPIKINYADGKQASFSVLSKSKVFEKADVEEWSTWDFKKH